MKAPYIVAEIGLNHGGDFGLAEEMIVQAAEAGANAVKFQAVCADTLVSKNAPTYFHQEGIPAETQHAFFSRSDGLDRYDYEDLAHKCKLSGIDFGCTVFTPEDVAWVDPLVKWHKVASADITNLPLLEAVAQTGKPVYLSTGACTVDEYCAALDIFFDAGVDSKDITRLHCVLSYPTPPEQAQLGVIGTLRDYHAWRDMVTRARETPVGYSDHTLFNLDVLTTAWLLGASVIEKHFTLDKSLPGNDHYHSMDPTDLRALVAKFQELQAIIGDGEKRVLPIEEPARQYARRGLYAKRDISFGKVLEPADIAILRPSARLGPELYQELIGFPAPFSRLAGEPL